MAQLVFGTRDNGNACVNSEVRLRMVTRVNNANKQYGRSNMVTVNRNKKEGEIEEL